MKRLFGLVLVGSVGVACGGGANDGNANSVDGGTLYGPACRAAAKCCADLDAYPACTAALEGNVESSCEAVVVATCADAGLP